MTGSVRTDYFFYSLISPLRARAQRKPEQTLVEDDDNDDDHDNDDHNDNERLHATKLHHTSRTYTRKHLFLFNALGESVHM